MGGAVAQQLAVMLLHCSEIHITKLTTLGSVGVGAEVNDYFLRTPLPQGKAKLNVSVLRVGGTRDLQPDYIPLVGGVHLGYGVAPDKCQIEVVYLTPVTSKRSLSCIDLTYPVTDENKMRHIAQQFFASFAGGHIRQVSLKAFSITRLRGRSEVQKHLAYGNVLEKYRQWLAWVLNIRPWWGRSTAESMEDYVKRCKLEASAGPPNSSSRKASRIGLLEPGMS